MSEDAVLSKLIVKRRTDLFVDLLVEAWEPDVLASGLGQLGAALIEGDEGPGSFLTHNGLHVVRCFNSPHVLHSTILSASVGRVIRRIPGDFFDYERDYSILVSKSVPGGRFFMCHFCRKTSFNPNDVANLYCSNCSLFHDPAPAVIDHSVYCAGAAQRE